MVRTSVFFVLVVQQVVRVTGGIVNVI